MGGAGECGAERARTISYAEKVVNAEEIGLKYLQKSQATLSKEPYICERVLCISKRALHPFHRRSAFPHMSSEHLKKSPTSAEESCVSVKEPYIPFTEEVRFRT